MKTFNLNSDVWDGTRDREGWRVKGALVGQRIGGRLIGATMSEVEPGDKLWPYHTHHLNEEWVIVLRGEPTLRTPEGEQVLKEGLSSMVGPDIIEYLDTGKVYATSVADELIMLARPGPTVEYWEGEE